MSPVPDLIDFDSGFTRGITFAPNVDAETYGAPPPLIDPGDAALFPTSPDDAEGPPVVRRSSHARKKPSDWIPRPPNAFILFRSETQMVEQFIKSQHVPGDVEANHGNLSKIIGLCWRNLPFPERSVWEHKARLAQAAHKAQYPHYRFRPRATSAGAPRRRVKEPPAPPDARRVAHIAGLLVDGVKGAQLATAVRELDQARAPRGPPEMRFDEPVTAEQFQQQQREQRPSSVPVAEEHPPPAAVGGGRRAKSSSPAKKPRRGKLTDLSPPPPEQQQPPAQQEVGEEKNAALVPIAQPQPTAAVPAADTEAFFGFVDHHQQQQQQQEAQQDPILWPVSTVAGAVAWTTPAAADPGTWGAPETWTPPGAVLEAASPTTDVCWSPVTPDPHTTAWPPNATVVAAYDGVLPYTSVEATFYFSSGGTWSPVPADPFFPVQELDAASLSAAATASATPVDSPLERSPALTCGVAAQYQGDLRGGGAFALGPCHTF